MQLSLPEESHPLGFLATAFSTGREAVTITYPGPLRLNGKDFSLEQPTAIAKALVAHEPALAGISPQESASVTQWILTLLTGGGASAQHLEAELTKSSYLAGNRFTVADAMALRALAAQVRVGPECYCWDTG